LGRCRDFRRLKIPTMSKNAPGDARQLEPAGVPEHVGVDREAELGSRAQPLASGDWRGRRRSARSLVWESKSTKAWSDGWIQKLKDDLRLVRDIAVILSEALPKDIDNFGHLRASA
jgi:hypothetical protein